MATRKPKTVKKVVNIMTNANPEFVSLVGHPANQTPFKAVKLDPTAVHRLAQVEAQQELAARSSAVPCDVHKMKFDKNVFKSEETVRSYLDARGWTDYSIQEDSKYFEVPNLEKDAFEGDLEDIPAQSGITMSVGRVKRAATPAEPAKEVSPGTQSEAPKTLEIAKKYDAWYAAWSNGTTLKDVMAEGYDGLPPGFWEIADAYFTALRNNLIEGNENAVRSLGDEFEDVLLKLVRVFQHLAPEMVQKMTTKPTDTTTTNPAPVAANPASTTVIPVVKETTPAAVTGGPEAPVAVLPGTTDTLKDTAPAAVQPEGENKDVKAPSASETEGLAETVTKSVLGAIGPALAEAMKPMTAKLETTETVLAQLSDRLSAVEAAQGQTRKSADIEEVTPPGTGVQKTVDPEKVARTARREERERAGLLGI